MFLSAITILALIFGGIHDTLDFNNSINEFHPFWKHRMGENEMKAICANHFKSYEDGLWTDYHGKKHPCPKDS